MGQVVKPPASRVCAGASERQRLGDAPTLDVVGYKLPSPSGEEMPRTSVHVVQVLVPLAVANMVWLHVVLRPKLTHKSLSVRKTQGDLGHSCIVQHRPIR